MFEEFGNLGLTREQFRELLLNFTIGMHIRRRAEAAETDIAFLEELTRHLLSFAEGFDAEDLVERSGEGLYPSRELDELCHAALEVRDNEEFWDRLEDELAFRDYLRTLPPLERLFAAEKDADAPEEFYRKYSEEFEKFGADRLVIDENQPPLEPRI